MGAVACPACGSTLSGSPKFCPECGAPVAAGTSSSLRKTVTLLFADATGSTALGERLDAEAYRDILDRFFAGARAAVERHGGTVEKFVGDAVLAVFGVPEVREDDALRAVRAAVEIQEAVGALSTELERRLGVTLEVRIGVNTGAVVTGAARAGGSFATGDAVNAAARLEQAASPGQILLGEETYALVRDAVEVRPLQPVAAKGKSEPLAAYPLVRVLEAVTGRARRTDTLLVGRQAETQVLDDALHRTVTTSRSHLVTVVGAPGMGKTRLIHEWAAGIAERASVVGGRCVSYGQGITYWPVVQLLRQALGLAGHESEEVTRHAIDAVMADQSDGDRVADLLLALLGRAGSPGDADETGWAVRRVLEQLATRQPLVVTIDDLHWAEATLLELLELVRREVDDLPLLLVCQARPELLDTHPNWASGSLNSMTVGLEPLTADQVATSLKSVLGGPVAPGIARVLAERSGGNPLFMEEIAAHLVDLGVLAEDPGGTWALSGDLPTMLIPPTVSALLAARLGRLPPGERGVLERVSVIGLEFTEDEAQLLVGESAPEVTDVLAALARRDLLRRVRSDGDDSWAFKHILVRDAAYETLPKALRAELHELFAGRLERDESDTGAERHAFVAHHLETTVRCRRELGDQGADLDHLVDRTVGLLVQTGDEAFERADVAAAEQWYRRAVDLAAPSAVIRRGALARLARTIVVSGLLDQAAHVIEKLRQETGPDASPLDHAFLHLMQLESLSLAGTGVDPADRLEAAQRTAVLAREAGDRFFLVEALLVEAGAWQERARWGKAQACMRQLAEEVGAREGRRLSLVATAFLVWGPAPMAEVVTALDALRKAGIASAHLVVRMDLTQTLAACAAEGSPALGRLDTTRAAAESLGIADTMNFHDRTAQAHAAAGDDAGAIEHFARAATLSEARGEQSFGSTILAWQLALMLELGHSLEEVRPRVEVVREWTSPFDVLATAQLAALDAVVAARDGDVERARDLAATAVRVVDESDQLWQQADIRWWVSAVPHLRGDTHEERRLLEEALDRYRRKGMIVLARRAEQRIATLP